MHPQAHTQTHTRTHFSYVGFVNGAGVLIIVPKTRYSYTCTCIHTSASANHSSRLSRAWRRMSRSTLHTSCRIATEETSQSGLHNLWRSRRSLDRGRITKRSSWLESRPEFDSTLPGGSSHISPSLFIGAVLIRGSEAWRVVSLFRALAAAQSACRVSLCRIRTKNSPDGSQ